jgi:Methyltransferase domain
LGSLFSAMSRIQPLFEKIFKIWRRKRWRWFDEAMQPASNDLILDVGGVPNQWLASPQKAARIDCINVYEIEWDAASAPNHRITSTLGDGCHLSFPDRSYDIVYSNSVIEHVGDWESQKKFANEVRRVGKKLWIQTPAFECPIEPHFLAPFVHWLPVPIRRRLLRWFTPWGWIEKPDKAKVDRIIATTELLSRRQVRELFPDCNIRTERLFFLFPKSYIAWRS